MINTIRTVIFILLLMNAYWIVAQQHTEPNMLEIPKQVILYKVNGEVKRVTVNQFYIGRFPESVAQYQEYLDQLPSDSLSKALPYRERLMTMNIREDLMDFLINEYYFSKDYESYPIVGLDVDQIYKYLKWKTNVVGKRLLRETGIEYDDELSYEEILSNLGNLDTLPLQIFFHIPAEPNIISAYYFRSRHNNKRKSKKSEFPEMNSKFLKKLKLQRIYEYDLMDTDNYDKMDELIVLIYPSTSTTEVELGALCNGKRGKFKLRDKPKNLLKPFRALSIKI